MIRAKGKKAKVTFGSGRRPGKPTGRAEGVVSHIVSNKKVGKRPAGASGAQSKFGYLGGVGAPKDGTSLSGAAALHFNQLAKLGQGGRGRPVSEDPHWHEYKDGHIERGEATFADAEILQHIDHLGPEHIAVGRAVTFRLRPDSDDEVEGEGIIDDFGDKGVRIITPEGEAQNVFWHELEVIEPPPKPKKRPSTNKDGKKQMTRGLWGRLSSLLTAVKQRAPSQAKVRAKQGGR